MARAGLKRKAKAPTDGRFFPSGSTLLDCVLGGGWGQARVLNVVGDRSTSKCIRDAFINIKGYGLAYVDDLGRDFPDGDSLFGGTLAFDRDEPCHASHFYKKITDKTIRYVTEHGFELTATPNHKVRVINSNLEFEMRRMDELSPGDHVIIAPETNLFADDYVPLNFRSTRKLRVFSEIAFPDKLNETLAEFLGFFVADGSSCNRNIKVTCYAGFWKRERFLELVGNLFPGAFKYDQEDFTFSSQVSDFVYSLFEKNIDNCTARKKFVPRSILMSPESVQAAFLRGLISCDSGSSDSNISYTTASRFLCRQIQMLLLNFGVVATFDCKYTKLPQWEEARPYYNLGLSGTRLDIFLEKIGLAFIYQKPLTWNPCSTYLSIPFAGDRLRAEISAARARLGWTRNGKIDGGDRFPKTKLFCRQAYPHLSREELSRCLELLEGFIAPQFLDKCVDILNTSYVFEQIESIEEINEPQMVYDVHVPDGHLFWASGFINHNTGLAIEACTNFSMLFGPEHVRYNEAEAAFDRDYAAELGFPDNITFTGDEARKVEDQHGSRTVEQFSADLNTFLDEREGRTPGLYVLDSLDALSDDAELDRKPGEASYGTAKAKALSEMFRKLNSRMERSGCTLMVISQIRDNIGVTFGEKKKRSGGHALDFYSSQIVWLSVVEKIKQKISGVDRIVGVRVRVMNKKNKLGVPFRSADFDYLFNYGIDDEISCLDWLKTNGTGGIELPMELEGKGGMRAEVLAARKEQDRESLQILSQEIKRVTIARWAEIEDAFKPTMKKYG